MTASGTVKANTSQTGPEYAYAAAIVGGPGVDENVSSGSGSGLSGFQSKSFSGGTSGTYTLVVIYNAYSANGGAPYAWAEVVLNWQ